MSTRSRRTFQQLVTLPDRAIPLAETALLMACEEYPQLEISPYLDQLDGIAATVRLEMAAGDSPLETIGHINSVLFDSLGFRGNNENYVDPRAYDKGLAMVDMLLLIEPDAPQQYRDRGLLLRRLRQFERAARDLEHYLKLAPDSKDRQEIQEHLRELRRIQAMMN